MPPEEIPIRTENYNLHETRMDQIDSDINKGKGWFQAASAFWGIAIVVVGFLGSNINSKLSNIESMLSADKSDIRLLNEQVKNLQKDVQVIQERHIYQDQERIRIK